MQPLFKDGFSGMMSVLVMIPFLFVGFDVIPQVAAEINAPKNYRQILIISIVSAVLFYLLIVFGVTMGLSESELATTSLATADAMVNLLGNQLFGTVLVLGGVAGIITSWNALSSARAAFCLRCRKKAWCRNGSVSSIRSIKHRRTRFVSGSAGVLRRCSGACPCLDRQCRGNRYYSRIFDRLDCIHEAEKDRAGFKQTV